jgi:hypothetical protein
LFFVAATLCGLFLASQSYLIYKSYESRAIPIVPVVVLALIQTWTWFLLLPGILAAANRFPLYRGVLSRNLAAHVVIGSLFALADIAIRVLINAWLPWYAAPKPFTVRFQNMFLNGFHSNLLVYWAPPRPLPITANSRNANCEPPSLRRAWRKRNCKC